MVEALGTAPSQEHLSSAKRDINPSRVLHPPPYHIYFFLAAICFARLFLLPNLRLPVLGLFLAGHGIFTSPLLFNLLVV